MTMTLAQKLDHYAKALIAATGVIILLVNEYAPLIPEQAQPYVAATVSALTAFGVWYKANGPTPSIPVRD